MKHQKTIEQNVINFIKRQNLIFDAKKIIIALSGGADSVFALRFFYKFKKKYKLKIFAVHVNHNLRGKESDNDEEFCRKLCLNLDIEFFAVNVNVKQFAKSNKLSTEEAARILRYNELEKFAENINADFIVTAHNMNDNTETILLNIFNGTGLNGVSGIPPVRGKIIRPFLNVTKEEIKNYLDTNAIEYREDSSNKNMEFKRNYLRNKIIPLVKKNVNPALHKVLLSSSEVFRNQKEIIDYYISTLTDEIVYKNGNEIIVKTKELKKYPQAVLGGILKIIFTEFLNKEYSFEKFLKLKNLVDSQTGTNIFLTKNIKAIRERGKIIIYHPSSLKQNIINISIGETIKLNGKTLTVKKIKKATSKITRAKNIEIISADKIGKELKIRKWQSGDKIQPLGMKGLKKISDILTDMKIPSYKKKEQLVLLNGKEIIWLLGLKLSDKYKITPTTKSAIKLWLK